MKGTVGRGSLGVQRVVGAPTEDFVKMRMISAIGIAAFAAIGFYSLGQWMRARCLAWERAEKTLMESEVLFCQIAGLVVNYWYVPAVAAFLGTLVLTAASSPKGPDDRQLV